MTPIREAGLSYLFSLFGTYNVAVGILLFKASREFQYSNSLALYSGRRCVIRLSALTVASVRTVAFLYK